MKDGVHSGKGKLIAICTESFMQMPVSKECFGKLSTIIFSEDSQRIIFNDEYSLYVKYK